MPDKSSLRRQGSSSSSSGVAGELPLRGIHINISSDPFQHRIPPYLQRAWQESRLRRYLSTARQRLLIYFAERSLFSPSSKLHIVAFAFLFCSACFILLLHVGFFSGKKYQDWQFEHYGWWQELEQQEVDLLHKLYPDQGRGQVTAVLLFDPKQEQWQVGAEASESLVPLIEQLCPYDMFASILVWNNNPKINLTVQALELSTCPQNKITIYNSPSHMSVAGRYLGCSLANTPYCYFQDQEGARNLRGLYANFLQYPHLVHGESRDPIAYAQARWRWCFFNNDIHMHTCHSTVGYGTFVSKETVSNFVNMVELDPIDIQYSDQYFVVYTNQVPYMIEGAQGSFPDEPDLYDREGAFMEKKFYPNLTDLERFHVHQALVSLYNHLDHRTNVFPDQEEIPSMVEQYAKTSCRDDRCLLLTNVDGFPDVRLFNYNVNVDMQISERIHDGYFNLESQYYKHPFKYAVDGDENTAWKSARSIRAGDFIGLDLLMPMRIPLRFRFLARHPYSYRRHLSLQISFDGHVWMEINPAPTMQCEALDDGTRENDAPLMECLFTMAETGYRFIRLQSMRDMDFKYQVHDFSFNAKLRRDVNGRLLDFDLDDESILA